jgi:hypothetical protein
MQHRVETLRGAPGPLTSGCLWLHIRNTPRMGVLETDTGQKLVTATFFLFLSFLRNNR